MDRGRREPIWPSRTVKQFPPVAKLQNGGNHHFDVHCTTISLESTPGAPVDALAGQDGTGAESAKKPCEICVVYFEVTRTA